jgi:hypothetical protein
LFLAAWVVIALGLLGALAGCEDPDRGDGATQAGGASEAGGAAATEEGTAGGATADGASADGHEVSEPVTHANLAVYFVYGDDAFDGETFLTLQEALKAKCIVVRETGRVRQLTVKNTGETPIYIRAGEIVRGGKQDRVLPYDMIVPAQSQELPIDSFCVEQGRWSGRTGQSAGTFAASENAAGSNALLTGAAYTGDQGKVWADIAEMQTKLAKAGGGAMLDADAGSSLELTMESKGVREAVRAYEDALGKALQGRRRVVGMATAVNGKIYVVDIYGSSALFRKLWPKLLKAQAVQAVAHRGEGTPPAPPAPEAVLAYMAKVREAQVERRQANNLEVQFQNAVDSLRFQCLMACPAADGESDQAVRVRDSYLATDAPAGPQPERRGD